MQVRDRCFSIEPDDGPDVALLRVATQDDNGLALPEPIPLMTQHEVDAPSSRGLPCRYPAWSPYNSPQDQQRIFDGIYEVKRLAPEQSWRFLPAGGLPTTPQPSAKLRLRRRRPHDRQSRRTALRRTEGKTQ